MFGNIFGKKSSSAPSTVSATSVARPTDPQTTIVQLREAISNQEKRYENVNDIAVQKRADTLLKTNLKIIQ
jgi:hypothetical protein